MKFLKELKGVESVSTLSDSDKENFAMIHVVNKGRKGNCLDAASFLKKIKGKWY
jgi:hypothetical protein